MRPEPASSPAVERGTSRTASLKARGRRGRLTVARVASALKRARGLHAQAAQILGCGREEIVALSSRSKRLRELAEEIAATNVDLAEGKLLKAVEEEKLGAVTFYLKTKGKARGYGDQAGRPLAQGRAPQAKPCPFDLSGLSDAELDALERLIEKARRSPQERQGGPSRAD